MATVTSNNISTNSTIGGAINDQAGAALKYSGISVKTFLISLAAGAVLFIVQFLLFVLIKNKLPRI
jgi:hypothetical protein